MAYSYASNPYTDLIFKSANGQPNLALAGQLAQVQARVGLAPTALFGGSPCAPSAAIAVPACAAAVAPVAVAASPCASAVSQVAYAAPAPCAVGSVVAAAAPALLAPPAVAAAYAPGYNLAPPLALGAAAGLPYGGFGLSPYGFAAGGLAGACGACGPSYAPSLLGYEPSYLPRGGLW